MVRALKPAQLGKVATVTSVVDTEISKTYKVSTHLCDLPTRGVQKVDQLRPLPLDFQQVSADVGVVFQVTAEILG